MDHLERCKRLLAQQGHSITKPRIAVFETLLNASEPLAIADIAKRLEGVDRVSVYRTVELFESVGIAQRVWTGFKSRIELSETFSPHHHHFTCGKCGKTVSVGSEALEIELARLENEHGFRLTGHSIELRGYCSDCR